MRWDNLFDDLESQLEHGLTAEEIDLRAEEERLRLARLSLRDRIIAIHAAGPPGVPGAAARADPAGAARHADPAEPAATTVRLLLSGDRTVDVRPLSFGRDWFSAELVEQSGRRSPCIIPLAAVTGLALTRAQVERSLHGPADAGAVPGGTLSARLGLGYVLRDLCRRRRAVELRLVAGPALHGTIDRVGRDHVDLAVHEAGVPRRDREVIQYRIVPLTQVELVVPR